MTRLARDLINNRFALRSQIYVNLKTTVATTRLGVLWWVLDPLLLMLIYYFVIVMVFDRGGPGYHLFALCGIVTWQSFARSVNLCTTSLVRCAPLIKQAAVPMVLYVLVSPLVQAFFYSIGLGIIAIWNHPAMGMQTPALLFLVLLVALVSFSLGLFLSILEVFFRDTSKIITYVLRFGFYLSPILYSAERVYGLPDVPGYLKTLYSLNPMVHIISFARTLLLDGRMFDWPTAAVFFGSTLVMMQIGLLFFYRMAPHVPKRL